MGEYQELKAIDGMQISSVSADLYGDGNSGKRIAEILATVKLTTNKKITF